MKDREGTASRHVVDTGEATLLRDDARRAAWTLLLDGVESSHVDLDDPSLLVFEYVRWLGDIVDCVAPAGDPLAVAHLGGGAMTLARYVAHTRPASRQVVYELDEALVALVRARLPLPAGRRLRVRIGDARLGLAAAPNASFDVAVRDAFAGAQVPDHLRTVEFAAQVKATLRPGGCYLLNVADGPPLALTGDEIATLLEVFAEVAVVSEPGVLRGRRRGNLVLLASDTPLPLAAIARRVADGAVQGRVRTPPDARLLTRGRRVLHDHDRPS